MKKMRVLLPAFLIALCLLWHVEAYSAGDKDGVITISTARQLAEICADSAGRQYVLGADITLPPGWVPIGQAAPGLADYPNQAFTFKGSLDGRGHTISGLSIDAAAGDVVGLFGTLEGAVISNIVLADARVEINGAGPGHEFAAGLLAGVVVGGTISNVTIKNGSISVTGAGYENAVTGGLAGRVEGTGTISECYINADVTGAIAGGFAGQLTGSKLSANANHTLEVTQCRAAGKVTSTTHGIAGGFVGEGEYVLIKESSAYGDTQGCAAAGGFVGRLSNSSRVIYSYAKGDVALGCEVVPSETVASPTAASSSPAKLPAYAGGFVGKLTTSSCVEFSYSAGTVFAGERADTVAGGFVGYISASGAPNTITHSLSFAPWVVGGGYVHRFAGRMSHDGVNGCYAHLGSMVVRGGSLAHVLPSAYGQDGADMSMAHVEDVTRRLGWRGEVLLAAEE